MLRPENILAVLAIGFAIIQFFDSRRQENVMAQQESRMGLIAESMSTRFAGVPPKNLAAIAQIVEQAEDHLDIMVDHTGYGMYSFPIDFERYRNALLKKRVMHAACVIHMIVYGPVPANTVMQRQFPAGKFGDERQSPRFEFFFKKLHVGAGVPGTQPDLLNRLIAYHSELQKNLCDSGVQVRNVDRELSLFLWSEDDEEAVFSVENKSGRDISIRTRDTKLISPLHQSFAEVWNDIAQPVPGCSSEPHPAVVSSN